MKVAYVVIAEHQEDCVYHYILPLELVEHHSAEVQVDKGAPEMGEKNGTYSMLFLVKCMSLRELPGDPWPKGCSSDFYDAAIGAWTEFTEAESSNPHVANPITDMLNYTMPDDGYIQACYAFHNVD